MTQHSWMKVLDGINWHLTQGPNSCFGILALSYSDLPYYLKSCFLYCGLFPEDFKIKARKLMQLWAAEGFLQGRGEETVEDIAEDYLEELKHRNMIQVARTMSDGGVKSCRVHDLLRDLAISEAEDAKFFRIHHTTVGVTSPISTRRLAIHLDVVKDNASENPNTSHHRTLILFADIEEASWRSLRKRFFKFLTVLDLENTYCIYNLPKNVGQLVNLKYMCLRRTGIRRIPPSIGQLFNLQTLELRFTNVKEMPRTIWKLQQLRHLCSHATVSSQTTKRAAMNDHDLGVDKLTNLHTLTLSAGSWLNGGGLKQQTQLRKLSVIGDLIPYQKVFANSVSKLTGLRSLRLFNGIQGPVTIPEFMPFSNHTCLYKLQLGGRLNKLPDAVEFYPPNLTRLDLGESGLKQDPMLILKKLPNLRILKFRKGSYMGKKMVCSSGGFSQLQILEMSFLYQLEEVIVEEEAMPALRSLEIGYCHKMEEVPQGLLHLKHLQNLKLQPLKEKMINQLQGMEGEVGDKIRRVIHR